MPACKGLSSRQMANSSQARRHTVLYRIAQPFSRPMPTAPLDKALHIAIIHGNLSCDMALEAWFDTNSILARYNHCTRACRETLYRPTALC